MKIIDCFIFYNELDILLYRLETLDQYIDYFVLVESKYTHSGKEKILYYNENIEMFEKFTPKIIHIVVDKMPYHFPDIDYSKNQQWENEHYQRNSIKYGIEKLSLNINDIIIISDLDEIPDPKLLCKIKKNIFEINNLFSLEQDFYYYNLNSKMRNKWYSSKILTFSIYVNLNASCQELRHYPKCKIINNAGWHLSYFGDKYFIQNKIKNFGHQEFNNINFTNLEIIDKRIKNQVDLYGRDNETIDKIPICNNSYLPPNYITKLSNFILY